MEKIIVKNLEYGYIHHTDDQKIAYFYKPSIPYSDMPQAYWYQSHGWRRGSPHVNIFDRGTGDVNYTNNNWKNNNKFVDCSLTLCDNPITGTQPTEKDVKEWYTRKIIKSIHIKRDLQILAHELGSTRGDTTKKWQESAYYQNISKHTYSIVQVNKKLIEPQLIARLYEGSKISDKTLWSKNQLIDNVDHINNHFNCDEINLTNMNYNLPADEDLVLIHNISFNTESPPGTKKSVSVMINHGGASRDHTKFQVVIHYINDFY